MKHKDKWLTPKGRLRTKFLSSLSFDSLLKLYKYTDNESLLNYIVNIRFKRKLKGKWKGITKKDYILFKTGKVQIELCNRCNRYYKTVDMAYCNVCKNYLNTKESVKQKYGVDNISLLDEVKEKKVHKWKQNKDEWIEKHKQTIRKKYGVDNISQIEYVKEKKKKSFKMLKKDYERLCRVKNDEFYRTGKFSKHELPDKFIDIIKNSENPYDTYLNLYFQNIKPSKNVEVITTFDEFKLQYWPRRIKVKCKDCKRVSTYLIDRISTNFNVRCKYCDSYTSYMETYFYDLLRSYNIKVLKHYNRGTKDGELDLYLPDYQLGIECQGLLWHSNEDTFIRDESKFNTYTNKGIRLFYIYEDDFQTKRHIIEDMLLYKLGLLKSNNKIYARQCKVYITNKANDEIKEFFNMNHMHGFVPGSEYVLLLYNNEIVSGMILSPNRFTKDKTKEIEIVRFCNKNKTIVTGGMSKCLTHSNLIQKQQNLIFFIDSSFGNNIKTDIVNRYKFLNYKQITKTDNSFYVVDLDSNLKYHRLKYKDHSSKVFIFRPFSWKIIL